MRLTMLQHKDQKNSFDSGLQLENVNIQGIYFFKYT